MWRKGPWRALGALHDLKPVLTRKGDDDAECLSVMIKTAPMNVLCVIGYGPQAWDSNDRKDKFWQYLEEEAKVAEEKGIGIIIQIDSNACAGENIIPGDPNQQKRNGKYLEEFLKSNPALNVVNPLQKCQGSITRHRKTFAGEENLILDIASYKAHDNWPQRENTGSQMSVQRKDVIMLYILIIIQLCLF